MLMHLQNVVKLADATELLLYCMTQAVELEMLFCNFAATTQCTSTIGSVSKCPVVRNSIVKGVNEGVKKVPQKLSLLV
jgi:hypothetical protein